ncbi:cytochrome P450 [Goodfellowiella coeruleoviolacea]|uniref:Cytochrome P450 n=1 Tax=Goodfellowiella coeruleoviolacea TaxID=334858 RepID=A0AAE3GGH5_9PSEU|nr:cytochrome P450 [Goodfellowiella coeruleoviolacea]MCP2167837.1 Cytochrome P450 [Goodfellowiella coeruleoviolacea]
MTEIAPQVPLFFHRDGLLPAAALAAARDEPGLRRTVSPFGQPIWVVARYEDARTVLGDPELFSNDSAPPMPSADDDPAAVDERRVGSLLLSDPPEHTRLRRMLAAEFTARRIARLEPRIAEITARCLDALEARGPGADLVAELADPLATLVICELLGVPHGDLDEFQSVVRASVDTTKWRADRDVAEGKLREYFGGLAARKRTAPGDDLLSTLIREHGDELSDGELTGVCSLLLAAGYETSSSSLAMGALVLLTHPAQFASLRDDPELIDNAVEELLRYLSVVHSGVARKATRDTVVGGQPVAAGDLLAVSIPAANHDPAAFADPRALDLTRRVRAHLAFGHGVHHCIGAPLARREMTTVFPALLRRFPSLALAVDPAELRYRVATVAHGVHELPVTWS